MFKKSSIKKQLYDIWIKLGEQCAEDESEQVNLSNKTLSIHGQLIANVKEKEKEKIGSAIEDLESLKVELSNLLILYSPEVRDSIISKIDSVVVVMNDMLGDLK